MWFVLSQAFRGAVLHRSRLNRAMPFCSLDTDVRFLGVEMMDSRQYRHTWVCSVIVGLPSRR